MDAKKFGVFISDRRKQQHMTQAELAGEMWQNSMSHSFC